jgi:hypothetical protein
VGEAAEAEVFCDVEELDYFEGIDIVVAAAFLDGATSDWFPEHRVILVDHRLTPRQKYAAILHELMGALTPTERDALDLWLAPGLDSVRPA